MNFIKVNGRILDTREYEKEVFLIQQLAEYEINEVLKKYGFEKNGSTYIHEEMLMKCTIIFMSATKPL